jgi:formylglycine-generating enzyme required for sulfatase activity
MFSAVVSDRVVRGGSWNFTAINSREAKRYGFTPEYRDIHLGFRVARGQPGG